MKKIADFLQQLISGVNFTSEQMYEFFQLFIKAPQTQQAASLALFSARNETAEELTGALHYLLDQATQLDYPKEIIEIVGTGGGSIKTINISTAASLVIASCGVKVAKHGGRSATSNSGSMDVLEKLHVPLYDNPKDVYRCLDQYNYAVLSASLFNPIYKLVAPLRKELGIPTMFNILGPIANPLRPKKQIIGVYRKDLMHKIAEVLQNSGSIHSMVIHSHDGLDEFSVSAPTYVTELKNGKISEYEVTPEAVGLKKSSLSEILCGKSPEENAKIILEVFSGKEHGAPLDVIVFNAAAGLVIADHVTDLEEGVVVAKETVKSGKTLQLLKNISTNSGQDKRKSESL